MDNKIIECSLGNTDPLEEIRCVNCGELSYLHESRPSGVPDICGYCGKRLHLSQADNVGIDLTRHIKDVKLIDIAPVKIPTDIRALYNHDPEAKISECHICGGYHSHSPVCSKSNGQEIKSGAFTESIEKRKNTFKEIRKRHPDSECICYSPGKVECEHTSFSVGSDFCLIYCKQFENHYKDISVVVCNKTNHDPESKIFPGAFTESMETQRYEICKAFHVPDSFMDGAIDHTKELEEHVMARFAEGMAIAFDKELIYGTGKEEPIGIIKGLESIEAKGKFEEIDSNLDKLKQLCSDMELEDITEEPETEITELIDGRWVTRKE